MQGRGIVDDNIQPPEMRNGFINQGRHKCRVRDVPRNRQRLIAKGGSDAINLGL